MRVKDPELLAVVRSLPCIVCGRNPAGEAHHLVPRSRGGGDVEANIIPLCSHDHTMGPKAVHRIGLRPFADANPAVYRFLLSHGWEFFNGKWFEPKGIK